MNVSNSQIYFFLFLNIWGYLFPKWVTGIKLIRSRIRGFVVLDRGKTGSTFNIRSVQSLAHSPWRTFTIICFHSSYSICIHQPDEKMGEIMPLFCSLLQTLHYERLHRNRDLQYNNLTNRKWIPMKSTIEMTYIFLLPSQFFPSISVSVGFKNPSNSGHPIRGIRFELI